jgi:hypothetical protein
LQGGGLHYWWRWLCISAHSEQSLGTFFETLVLTIVGDINGIASTWLRSSYSIDDNPIPIPKRYSVCSDR